MRTIGHDRGKPCPRCSRASFCDDCNCCESKVCGFCPPEIPLPPDGAELVDCAECGDPYQHRRTCPVTLRAAAS